MGARVPWRAAAATAAAVAALGFGACGGGDDPAPSTAGPAPTATVPTRTVPTSTAALTADEYRREVGALCAELRVKVDVIPDPTTPDEVVRFLERGLVLGGDVLARQQALVPPPELADLHERSIATRQELLAGIAAIVAQARAGQDPITLLQGNQVRLDALDDELGRIYAEAGVTECAAGDPTGSVAPGTTPTAAGAAAATTHAPLAGSPAPTTGDAEIDRFLEDIRVAAASVARTEGAIGALGSRRGRAAAVTTLRREGDDLRAAISRMNAYTLADRGAEAHRWRLVEEGPAVADLMDRLVAALVARDAAAVDRVSTRLTAALRSFAAVLVPTSS